MVFEPADPEVLKGAVIVRAGPQGFVARKDGKMIIVHASVGTDQLTGCPDECNPEPHMNVFIVGDPYKTMSSVSIRPEELVGRRLTVVRVFDDEVILVDEDTNEVFGIDAFASLPNERCENECEPDLFIDTKKFVNKYPPKKG